jgi:hypothetical protein
MLVHRRPFRGCRLMLNAAGAAAVSHAVRIRDRVFTHDRIVDVCVVNNRRVHAHDGGVIAEHASLPHAAHETNAHVAETVVHSAVIADSRSPVSGIEDVLAV